MHQHAKQQHSPKAGERRSSRSPSPAQRKVHTAPPAHNGDESKQPDQQHKTVYVSQRMSFDMTTDKPKEYQFSAQKSLASDPLIFEYLAKFGNSSPQLLTKVREATIQQRTDVARLMLDPTGCNFLQFQARAVNALRVLEIGTFTGVTAVALATGIVDNAKRHNIPINPVIDESIPLDELMFDPENVINKQDAKDNKVVKQLKAQALKCSDGNKVQTQPLCITLDVDSTHFADVGLPHCREADLVNKPLVFIKGKAVEIIQELLTIDTMKESFDMIFIDADKQNYHNYYELSLQLLKKGGIICVDNVLWKGNVVNYMVDPNFDPPTPPADKDQVKEQDKQQGKPQGSPKRDRIKDLGGVLHRFNEHVHNDSRVYSMILPQGDGLSLIYKL